MTMSRRGLIAATALSVLAASRGWSQAPQPEPAPPVSTRTPLRTRFAGQFTGDFDAMLDRRLIRLVVPYSPTAFFEDKGTIYGTAANGAQLFEHWINKTFALGARPLTVPLTPVSRDKLFDTLLAGDGDIAAGDITVTEERRKKVAFSAPVIGNVREIVITGEDIPELDSAEALSGKEVAVQRREDCPSARAHQNAEHELEFFDRRSPACEHQTEAQQATTRQKDGRGPNRSKTMPQPKLARPMTMKLNVIASEISARDQPVPADIGCRNTGSEKIEPIATQPIKPPAATITQR